MRKIIDFIKYSLFKANIIFLLLNLFILNFNKKIRVAIVAIGKMENNYIKEWVEHYYNLGVKKIFLYDNNDINGENFEDVINKYIKAGFVELINFRGRKPNKFNLQSQSYLNCYQKRVKYFDYLGIFDIDEFLEIGKNVKIYEYLSQSKFKNFQCIRFPSILMNDNNLITVKNNNYSLQKRFIDGKFTPIGKSIMRTGLKQINSTLVLNGHGPIGLISCDPDGYECNNGVNSNFTFVSLWKNKRKTTKEYVKHFSFKTLQEYIDIKMNRLYASRTKEESRKRITLDLFFKFNNLTTEKLNYINKRGFFYSKDEGVFIYNSTF